MYRDAFGKQIKRGCVVASYISINHETFKGFHFSTKVAKMRGRVLVLDGVHCWGEVRHQKPEHMVVIDADSDMRKIGCYFIELRRKQKEEGR